MLRGLIPSLLLFGLCLTACGGLGGEPEIIATVALPQPTLAANTEERAFPQTKPNLTEGARIFAEHCTSCHGSAGDGQGELVLAGSIPQPLDMTQLELTRHKTPQDWYEIITNGNIEKLMPPWQAALTQQQRWDVALYAYSRGYDETLLKLGEQVWAEKCPRCSPAERFTDWEASLAVSDADLGWQINREDFGALLKPEEISAAVAYARLQSLANIGETDSKAANPTVPIGSFTGRVQHGTVGGSLPADTVVQLHYGNPELGFSFAETTLDEDFSFRFEGIPLTTAFTYNVGAIYLDRLFARRLLVGHPEDMAYHQNIIVYDLTNDPSVVSVLRIELFIEPIQLNHLGSGLFVSQIIRYRNSSDRIYTSGRGFDDGREATLLIHFPTDAHIMSGDENGRYVVVEDMENVPDLIIDTLPIPPGDSHEVIVEYFVPYIDGLMLEQAFNNVIDGEVTVTLPNSLHVISDTLNLNAGENALRVFSGRLQMDAQPSLAFEVAGVPFATSSDDQNLITSDILLPLFGVVALVAAVMAGILVRRRQAASRQIDRLIQQIAQLDEKHDQGQINHDVYQRQRRILKEELGRLMPAQKAGDESHQGE